METILSLKNLDKKFGRVHAVNNLSFDIQKGNVYGILGPNGSGKSTTLGIILNVVNKTSGEFSWFDGNLSTHQALKKVGAIIERPNFYPYMTAIQNLSLICKIKDISTEKINEKLIYLQNKSPDEDIPFEFDVKRWSTFLPPLFPVHVSEIQSLPAIFKEDLLSDVQTANPRQFQRMSTLYGKMTVLSMRILELIQKVVNKDSPDNLPSLATTIEVISS